MSREALRRAEAQLSGEAAGVRDEIGFLLIHQRYADRFFPGTSVLHTRLRYILFVPWMYEGIGQGLAPKSINRAVEHAETQLAGRLSGVGIIGGQKFPDATSQPPSIVYWTALGAWGLLRPSVDGRLPSRARVHAALQKKRRTSMDDDGESSSKAISRVARVGFCRRHEKSGSGRRCTPDLNWVEGGMNVRNVDFVPPCCRVRINSIRSPSSDFLWQKSSAPCQYGAGKAAAAFRSASVFTRQTA
jgi:hypothetical protein